MVVAEIGLQSTIAPVSCISPFTFVYQVNIISLAHFWTQVFGVPDESTTERSFILAVIIEATDRFTRVESVTECQNTFESWIFVSGEQKLYINYGTLYNPLLDQTEQLKAFGICDTSVIYVDDIAYLPVITGSPKMKQMQDMINYDKLAFSSATIQVANESGSLGFLKTATIFSNDCALYFLDFDGRSEYTRDDLIPLAWYLIENLSISKKSGKITLQDIRKSLNVKVPNTYFTLADYPNIETDLIDNPIPLLFGTAIVTPVLTNGTLTSGVVTFRAAQVLTALTTVQVYNSTSETWVTVTPTVVNLTTGEFTLSEGDGRGTSGDDARECRVTATGYASSKPSQVIVKLEELANGTQYTSTFYDLAEIASEEATLESISLYLDEQEELFEVIRKMQEGSSNRFRYEINAEGLRTIRLDNLDRVPVSFVAKEEIVENGEMEVYTDKDTIAASIKVIYGNDFTVGDDSRPYVIDTSQESAIAQSVRERPQIEFETFLDTREKAVTRATLEANRLGQVRRFTDITIMGKQFLDLRIYDILTVQLTDELREWMGVWDCQVLSIAPDTTKMQNKVKLLLAERVADIDEEYTLRITTAGKIRITESATEKVRVI